jgi:hypothetical protein
MNGRMQVLDPNKIQVDVFDAGSLSRKEGLDQYLLGWKLCIPMAGLWINGNQVQTEFGYPPVFSNVKEWMAIE